MQTQIHSDDISLFSIAKELKNYSLSQFHRDLLAALSVALLTVPQAMAYALLAGLPLMTGLLASIYSSLIAAIFGSSRHLIVGPSNAIAILMQAGTAQILFSYYRGEIGENRDLASLQILTQLTLLIGIIQLFIAGAKLGRLTQFISHSVIIGYITGTAIAVLVNQSFPFLGIPTIFGDHAIYKKGWHLFTHLNQLHIPTAIVGIVSLIVLLLLKRFDRRVPSSLIMLALSTLSIYFLNSPFFASISTEGGVLTQWKEVILIADKGDLSNIWPHVVLPFFDIALLNQLLPLAFAIALLSIMETTSVAKTISANSGQRLAVNQEIFGIGLGNLCSSLISAMPVSASPSRSVLNYSLGAQTRLSAILNIIFVAFVIFCFSFLIMHIPMAALSALLLVTSATLVQPKQFFLCMKATNSDALVLWVTLLSCIFLSLDIAFYIGVMISVTLYLKKAALPQLVEYDIDTQGELCKLETTHLHEHRTIRIIKVEGELFFGAADIFQTTLKAIAEDDTSTKVIILQLKNARDIDATVCLALNQLHDYLKGSRRFLIACGMLQQVWDVLSDSGMVELIGKDNLFVFDEKHPHQYMVKAMRRAHYLIKMGDAKEAERRQDNIELSASAASSAV